jgi:hypothetical protein
MINPINGKGIPCAYINVGGRILRIPFSRLGHEENGMTHIGGGRYADTCDIYFTIKRARESLPTKIKSNDSRT